MASSKNMAIYDASQREHSSLSYYDEQASYGGPEGSPEPPSARVQLEKALDILIRQRWIVIGTFVLFVLGAIGYSYSQDPEYDAFSSILVDLGNTKKSEEDLSVRIDDPFARNDWSLDAELFILQSSNTIADRVAERLVMMHDTAQTALNMSILYTEEGAVLPAKVVSSRLRGYVRFSTTKPGINVLVVKASSGIPQEAALLANLYAEEYVRTTQEANRTHVTTKREFLEQQEYERREELRTSEEAIKIFLQERGTTGAVEENQSLLSHLVGLEMRRDAVNIELMTRKSKLASIQRALSEIQPDLVKRVASSKSEQIESLQGEIAGLELQKTQIEMRYADQPERLENAPELDRLVGQIALLQSEVERLSAVYIQEIVGSDGTIGGAVDHLGDLHAQALQQRIEIDGLEAQLSVIDTRIRERKGELQRVPENSMELSRLQRERDYAEQMYQSVMKQLQATRLNEVSEPGYAQVIKRAGVPFLPVRPRPQRNLLIGILFGLFTGVAFAYARHAMVTEILEPEQLQTLGFPVLSVVPDMSVYINQAHGGLLNKEWAGRSVDVRLISLFDPGSVITEAYKNTRAKIELSDSVMEARTLLVTSPGPNDGKSLTAANLAIVMAQAGRKTILVDADLRRPSVHELFGMSNATGLSDLYRSKPNFEWSTTRTPLKNLFVLPSGRIQQNPVELVSLDRTHDIISLLQEWFDVIIFDTPPVLLATETKMLAAQCHNTLLVARANWTKEEELKHAVQELYSVDTQILGTILNGFDVTKTIRHRNRYRYYSSYEQLPA